jgi:hypothetical protein
MAAIGCSSDLSLRVGTGSLTAWQGAALGSGLWSSFGSLPHARSLACEESITEMCWMQLVLFGMHERVFGPCSAASHRILIPVMEHAAERCRWTAMRPGRLSIILSAASMRWQGSKPAERGGQERGKRVRERKLLPSAWTKLGAGADWDQQRSVGAFSQQEYMRMLTDDTPEL